MKVRIREWWHSHKSLSFFVAAVSMLAGLLLFRSLIGEIPSDDEILSYRSPQTSKVYARDGRLVATLFEQNRTPVKLDQISRPSVESSGKPSLLAAWRSSLAKNRFLSFT